MFTRQQGIAVLVASLLLACSGGGGGSKPRPKADKVVGRTQSGGDNDEIEVVFLDDVEEADVEDPSNWTVESPVGTPFDLTNSTIDYDPPTRTATVTLGPGTLGTIANANNLQTRDSIAVGLANIHGTNGRAMLPLMIGVDALTATVGGDDDPPTVLGAFADGLGTTTRIRFSEPCKEVLYANLYSGLPGDPGERFVLTDLNATPAVAAVGTVTFLLQSGDGDTVVVDDGTRAVTFEFDNDASVVNSPTLRGVQIGFSTWGTTSNFRTAVNDGSFTFDVSATKAGTVCTLTNDVPGTAGNVPIATTGIATVPVGMLGGLDAISLPVDPFGAGFGWDPDDQGLTVDYSPTVPLFGADQLEVYAVIDLAGNQAFAVPALGLSSASAAEPALAPAASTLTVVPGERNDTIVVRFAEPMSPFHMLEPANYSAEPLDLSAAEFAFDGVDTVTITLDEDDQDLQFGVNYALTLVRNSATPLTTKQGVEITGDAMETIGAVGDGTAITLGGMNAALAGAADPDSCLVVFPEAVAVSGATDVANYAISAVMPIDVTAVGPRAVRLTFAAPPTATDVVDVQPAAATDRGGNPAAGVLSVVVGPADTTAPTATLAAFAAPNVGGDWIEIRFDEPLDPAGALDLANYAISVESLSLDLTGAVLGHDSTTDTVLLHLPDAIDLPAGSAVDAVLGAVTDLSGNAVTVQPATVFVGGDSTPPDFAAAFVDWVADGSGQTVEVGFDEDVNAAFVETVANWSASLGTPITAVVLVAPQIARVTTNGQLGAAETLDLTGLPDVAGNLSGAISIDPHE